VETLEKPFIHSLIPADSVELIQGRFNITGGAWNIHKRPLVGEGQIVISHIHVAAIVAIPWHQINQTHTLIMALRNEDARILTDVCSPVKVGSTGRPQPFATQYARSCTSFNVVFPCPGSYEIMACLEGIEGSERSWYFLVEDSPQ